MRSRRMAGIAGARGGRAESWIAGGTASRPANRGTAHCPAIRCSPGPPLACAFFETLDPLLHYRQTDYRNPVLSEALATLGYVNAFGRGVIRAQDALRRNGNPAAEFTFDTSQVLATVRKAP